MTDKIQSGQPQPIVKIGHYTLGQTLGVGTFGKVKSKKISLLKVSLDSKHEFGCYIGFLSSSRRTRAD